MKKSKLSGFGMLKLLLVVAFCSLVAAGVIVEFNDTKIMLAGKALRQEKLKDGTCFIPEGMESFEINNILSNAGVLTNDYVWVYTSVGQRLILYTPAHYLLSSFDLGTPFSATNITNIRLEPSEMERLVELVMASRYAPPREKQ